jgi:hypothetical protein
MPEVDLAFIARQLERLVNDMAGLKDDMIVVMARLDRLDAATQSLVTEVRAMHSRHERSAKRSCASKRRIATFLPDGRESLPGGHERAFLTAANAGLRISGHGTAAGAGPDFAFGHNSADDRADLPTGDGCTSSRGRAHPEHARFWDNVLSRRPNPRAQAALSMAGGACHHAAVTAE